MGRSPEYSFIASPRYLLKSPRLQCPPLACSKPLHIDTLPIQTNHQHWRLGGVATGKSISVALRACVRSCVRACQRRCFPRGRAKQLEICGGSCPARPCPARSCPARPPRPRCHLSLSRGSPLGRHRDKDSLMDWDSLMDCQGAQSQKEGQRDQGGGTKLGGFSPQLF